MRNLGGGDQGHRRRPRTRSKAPQARGHRGRHRPPHRDQDQTHLEVRLASRPTRKSRRSRRTIEETEKNLRNLTRFTIRWFEEIGKQYGKGRERRTEIASFEKVEARQVVLANEMLYLNASDGFAGYGLKKDDPVEKCSTMDDVIAITREGVLKVIKVAEKFFVGKNPAYLAVFRKEDKKTYSMIYRDGRDGPTYAKRFEISGVTRDREYDLTRGRPGSRVLYFAAHDSREESDQNLVRVVMKPALRLRNLERDFLFGELAVKGRSSKGNLITKHGVDRVVRAPKA
jgi:topoisomerase IV subunit A